MKSKKYFTFCISTLKSQTMFARIDSSQYKNGRKYDCDKRLKNVLFWYWFG